MDKKALYESIMRNVAKEVKRTLDEAYDQKNRVLNNQDAYYFLMKVMTKAIIMTLGENKAEIKKNDLKQAKMLLKVGKGRAKDVNLFLYKNNSFEVSASQSKMMWMKNMAFISGGNLYIVDGELLRANWSNPNVCRTLKNSYDDSLGEKSIMSRFKLDFLIENADNEIKLSEEARLFYETEYAKIF